jgi:outer membrane protein assembly factor BamB
MTNCRILDPEGHPIVGVTVSNGRSVAVTDRDGGAALGDEDAAFVWVSRPSGYDTDRWFHRLGGSGAESVQFTLRPVEQALPVTFAQVTDLHLSDLPEPESLPLADSLYGLDGDGTLVGRPLTGVGDLVSALGEIASVEGPHGRPGFAVATGDLTDHGTASEFAMLAEAVGASPLPVHLLPGNHDHYGHNHEPHPDDAPVDSHGMGTGTTTRYEEHVGPRWWSLTHAGLRLVAIDWFSHRLGLDRAEQEEWLTADLATAPEGTPVLLLTHDQMPADFFERVGAAAPHVRILGSLSGHWHTSRVIRVGEQIHANTGNSTFGSFDWAPAHTRLVTWDGQELALRTVALGTRPGLTSSTFSAATGSPIGPESALWSVRLPGAVHLARPATLDDGSVVVAWSDDDRATGGVACHEVSTGEQRWQVALDGPVRGGATHLPGTDTVVAVSVSGGVVAVDARTGEVRWSAQVGEPTMAWVYAAPVPLPGAVAVGDIRGFAALSADDGTTLWYRDDLGPAENATSPMQGALQDGLLVIGFTLAPSHTLGLDPASGETRWSADGIPFHSAASDFVADPGGTDLYLTRLGGRVERMAAATGRVRWAANVRAAFATGRPLLVDDGLLITTALGAVHRFDAATGEAEWRTDLPGDRLLAMGPYRREGLAVPAGPALIDGQVVQTAGDGKVHVLDPDSGANHVVADLGVPITVPAAAAPRGAVVATAEGTLTCIPL